MHNDCQTESKDFARYEIKIYVYDFEWSVEL